ncbi:MAG: endopeptidase La [Bacteroidia bacterium]|nr:endopeptidase La [Bacteroidia bacterium]
MSKFEIKPFGMDSIVDEDTEFIPVMTTEEEESMNKVDIPTEVGILPLRNTVLFPGVVIPITVGRDKSIKLIQEAYKKKTFVGVVSQKDQNIDDPGFEDLNQVGTLAVVIKLFKMPDGSTTAIIQGKKRFNLDTYLGNEPYLKATIQEFVEIKANEDDQEYNAIIGSVKDISHQIIKLSPNIPSEAGFALNNIDSTSFLLNFISSNMNATVAEKQQILEITDQKERAKTILAHLSKDLQLLEIKNQIQSKVKVEVDKQQREYFLNQQLKTIKEELGGGNDRELEELKEKAKTKKWTKQTQGLFEKELDKLGRMNPNAAEYSIQMNYLETLLELPWNDCSKDNFDLKNASKVLDKDHFGLDKVKKRILEHLAVLKLKGDMKSPILCLYGPPGVGKTSLGKSIAKALGRKYVRMSLGGLRDEAEIRGHRKTYIGAMPGRIIQNIKKVNKSNPVFVLDEIDKVGASHQGDPSSALLEVLDPEQNTTFYDNYLEMDYDLSKVMFIATANNLNSIQPALLDRMEIIDISGYTLEEKIQIAKNHLVPKQIEEHGLKKKQVELSEEVLAFIIDKYTRESGVRTLEREVAKVIRAIALKVAVKEDYLPQLSIKEVGEILGISHYNRDKAINNDLAGVVTGLAWTPFGGDILFIETSLSKGKSKLTLTGNLGDVMKESAIIALEYLKAHGEQYGIAAHSFDNWNIHIHVPEGATPKDGPSAGITIFVALLSAFTQQKVKSNLAMTGEITLRGKILPVGGIKEKILAAKRSGITNIILCADNKKDVEDINDRYLEGLRFQYVSNMEELFEAAILPEKVSKPLDINFIPAKETRI